MSKKLSDRELEEFENNRDIWQETLNGIRQIKKGQYGRKFTFEMSPIVETRNKIGFSQSDFAKLLGVSKRTLQDWEQGRRKPSGPARSLLILAEKRPEVLQEFFC